jgi:hypothetical protein
VEAAATELPVRRVARVLLPTQSLSVVEAEETPGEVKDSTFESKDKVSGADYWHRVDR